MAGVFRCPTLIGRLPALELIDGLLSGVKEQAGGCLVLVGEAGVGKSRLVAEGADRAADESLTVLAGRASIVAGGASLRPVAEAVAGFARTAPGPPAYLRGFLPILARFVPDWEIAVGPEGSPVLLGEAILRLADGQPEGALLILEDLHWADPDTLQVLEYLADACASSRLGVIVTCRPTMGPLMTLIASLSARGTCTAYTLPRLSTTDGERVGAACLGVQGGLPAPVRELVEAADGLPLLVEELLADAASRNVLRFDQDGWTMMADASVAAPPSYAESVASRLGGLGAVTEQVLKAAAIIGRDFDERLLGAVTGLPEADVVSALRAAESAQLVERLGGLAERAAGVRRFRHALTREAVLSGIPANQRKALGSDAADASAAAGATPDVIAGLLVLAERPDEAAGMLLSAAEGEARVGTHAAGIAMLSKARSLAKDPLLARQVAVAQVHLLAAAGRAPDAFATARDVLPFLPAPEARAIRLRLSGAALHAQDANASRAQLDTVKALGDLSDTEWAQVWSLEAGLALAGSSAERVTEAEHLAHRAVAAAERAGLPPVQCESLLVLGRCARLRNLVAAEDAFRAAFQVADAADLAVERVNALAEMGTIQMLREVRADTLEQAHEAAERIGAPVIAAGIGVNLVGVRIMRGELDEAVAAARRTQEESRRLGLTGALAATTMFEGISHGLDGRTAEMDRLLESARLLGKGDPDVEAGSWAIGRATVAFLDEDRDRARRALGHADEVIRRNPVLMIDPAAGPAVLLKALEGTTTWSEIDDAERRSGLGSAWTRMWIESARGVLAGTSGERDPKTVGGEGLAAASRYPVFGLVAARLVAEAQLRDGWGDPLPLLADLEVRARERGYPRLASACRSMQRAAGVRVPRRRGVDLLLPETLQTKGVTAREAEVLALVGERLTSPEIARRLFLSPRTVEKHVASLLTKTGARGRAELADMARGAIAAEHEGG